MRAVLYDRWGGPEVLRLADIDVPMPRTGEVLVRVVASSINSWDWDLLTGKRYFVRPPGFAKGPRQLGFDVAGVVEQIGPRVGRLRRGDAVVGDLAFHGPKAFAEFVVMKETALAVKPEGLGFVRAAALPQAGLLAALGLSGTPEVESGSRVLVNGAGGGVGLIAIQLAKLQGAHVTGVDSAVKLEAMLAAGADRTIDYAETDFTRTGERYDRILDVVAGRSSIGFARALAPRGRLAVIGGTPGTVLDVVTLGTVLGLLIRKRLGLVLHKPERAGLERLAALCVAGQLAPVVDSTYPLERIQDAFARFASGRFAGKIVLTVDPARTRGSRADAG